MTLTTRVEKPPKLERLQNKIPDIKFDFLLLDFIRNKCSRKEHLQEQVQEQLQEQIKEQVQERRKEQFACSCKIEHF